MIASKVLCLIAGVDYSTISTCPNTDRLWATHLGLALLVSFLVVWGISFHATSYIIDSVAIRCIAALVIALSVLMFDRALFQADWFLQPVGREPRNNPSRWLRIGLRLGISFCLSFALALFLELAIFSDTITERLQEDFRNANAALFQEMTDYQTRLDEQIAERSRRVREVEDALSKLEAESSQTEIQRLQARLLQLDEQIGIFEEDRNAELHGVQTHAGQTGHAGRGPAFRFAQAQIDSLTLQRGQIQDELVAVREANANDRSQLRTESDRARQELAQLTSGREAVLLAYRTDRIEASPEFQHKKDDPLARMAAYTELKKDPTEGPTIIFLSWLLRFSVMFLEVAPLAAKMLFGPPTVYATKISALLEMERHLAYVDLKAGNTERIVGDEYTRPVPPQPRRPQLTVTNP